MQVRVRLVIYSTQQARIGSVEDARATLERRPKLRAQVEDYMKRAGVSLEQMIDKGARATDFPRRRYGLPVWGIWKRPRR